MWLLVIYVILIKYYFEYYFHKEKPMKSNLKGKALVKKKNIRISFYSAEANHKLQSELLDKFVNESSALTWIKWKALQQQ